MRLEDDHPDLHQLAAKGEVVSYFGYGSLVNRRTLRTSFLGMRRARAFGWQRLWLPRIGNAEMALLSVLPTPGAELEGVIVYDRAENLSAVDEREAGYVRRSVEPDAILVEDPPVAGVPCFIYEAPPGSSDAATVEASILQSYLDAVLQGFLDLYGQAGVDRFVAATRGFETVVIRDRREPRYPRATELPEALEQVFDEVVTRRGARFVTAAGANDSVFRPERPTPESVRAKVTGQT